MERSRKHDFYGEIVAKFNNILIFKVIYVTDNTVLLQASIKMSHDEYICAYIIFIYEVFVLYNCARISV